MPNGFRLSEMRLNSLSAIFISAVALLLITVVPAPRAEVRNGKIAFASYSDRSFEIYSYSMYIGGWRETRLTNNSDVDLGPAWSPDGSKIAFSSGQESKVGKIFIMNADGSGQKGLTVNSGSRLWGGDYDPDWSPDGSKIAFSTHRDGNGEIYVINADGSGQRRLTNRSASDRTPTWSPDGSKIAFASLGDGGLDIYIMNAEDGSGLTKLRMDNNLSVGLDPAWSPDGSKIAISSDVPGGGVNSDIYVVDADGSGRTTRLTEDPATDRGPTWSPDGTEIAFVSERLGHPDIFVMNAEDGSGQRNLTADIPGSRQPDWSPDGSKIAFSTHRDGNYEIYVINADGSGLTRLTNNSDVDLEPTWSPDGSKMAFSSERTGNFEIYVMSPDGSGQERLTNRPAYDDGVPAWSSDGSRIAFSSQLDENDEDIDVMNSDIYVMNADGSGTPTNLTNSPDWDIGPAWSPDGSKIAFSTHRDGNYEIYVINADGSGLTRLTNNSDVDLEPDWSPDGSKIAFSSERTGNFEIYVMSPDGGAQTRLTDDPATDRYPEWSPDGSKIAFASDRDWFFESPVHIFIMNADGSGQQNIRPSLYSSGFDPSWQPVIVSGRPSPVPGSKDKIATADNSCLRPRYSVTTTTKRYIRIKDLKRGLRLKVSASHPSRVSVRFSLRRHDLKRLRLKGRGTVAGKIVSIKGKSKSFKVPFPAKFRKYLMRSASPSLKLKVVVVARASGVPKWRKLERRAPLSVVLKRKGRAGRRQISSTKSVLGISPCAKRLKVNVKTSRRGSVRNGLHVSVSSNAPASGKLELVLQGRDRKSLKLTRNFSKKIYRSKVRLEAEREVTKEIQLLKNRARRLARAMRARGIKRIRPKLVLLVKGVDGQRVRKAVTVRFSR